MNQRTREGMTVPVKTSELDRAQEESDIAFKALNEAVNQLTSRLSKVMGPSHPEDENETADSKYYSKLAQDIDSRNDNIWSIVRLINSVIERLEI